MAAHKGTDGDEITRMWMDHIPTKDIADAIGCSVVNVRKRALAMGLPPRSGMQGGAGRVNLARVRKSQIDQTALRMMWADGLSGREIGKAFGVSDSTIYEIAADLGLPQRDMRRVGKNKRQAAPPAPITHVAAVVMPAPPLQARKDWPDLLAAVQRAKGNSAPQATLAIIATRFRLPVAVVQGLAGREWAK